MNDDPIPKSKRRRGYSSLDAIDPRDGGKWQFLLSDDKMDWVASQGRGAALELADTVRWSLLHPRAIFRGIRDLERDVVEEHWLCYVACPQHAYDHKTGEKRAAWSDEVFMVFVTDDRIIYGWYWGESDQHDLHLPNDAEEPLSRKVAVMANDVDLNDAFAQRVLALANSGSWTGPKAFFNPEGDCIEVLLSNESYRARRLDSLVTVYESRDKGELVGALVKGVRGFIGDIVKRFPGFKIEIVDGKVKLQYLFAAGLWKDDVSENRTLVKTYEKLREAAERAALEVELEAV